MGKWKVHSLRNGSDAFGCLVVFVAILIVVLAIASVALYLIGYFPMIKEFLTEFGFSKLNLHIFIAAFIVLAGSLCLSYLGFTQMTLFAIFDIAATAWFGFYFYRAVSASSVGEDLLTSIPIAAWLAIVCAIAVSLIPSLIASIAVRIYNVSMIKKSEGYKLFIEKYDEFLPTQRLYKVLITSEKISMRSPTGDMCRFYFDELGYDDLFGRAFDAFIAAAGHELGSKFSKRHVEDYCVAFTNKQLSKQIKSAVRRRKTAVKNGLPVSDKPIVDARSDKELARDTRKISLSEINAALKESESRIENVASPVDVSDEGEFLRKDPLSISQDFIGDRKEELKKEKAQKSDISDNAEKSAEAKAPSPNEDAE